MASREKMKMDSNLELAELKKDGDGKAISLLRLQWNGLHSHLDSSQSYLEERFTQLQSRECYLEERFNELESREKRLLSIQESVSDSNKQLDSIRHLLEEKAKAIEHKHREFRAFQKQHINELKLKEKQLDLIRKSVEGSIKEMGLSEEKLVAHQRMIEGFFQKLDLEMKQFQNIQKSSGERLEEINRKEMQLESTEALLQSARKCINDALESCSNGKKRKQQSEGKSEKKHKISGKKAPILSEEQKEHCKKALDLPASVRDWTALFTPENMRRIGYSQWASHSKTLKRKRSSTPASVSNPDASVDPIAYEDVDRDIIAKLVQDMGGSTNPPAMARFVVTHQRKQTKKIARKKSTCHVAVSEGENSSQAGEQIRRADEVEGGHEHGEGTEKVVAPNLDEDVVREISPPVKNITSRTSLSLVGESSPLLSIDEVRRTSRTYSPIGNRPSISSPPNLTKEEHNMTGHEYSPSSDEHETRTNPRGNYVHPLSQLCMDFTTERIRDLDLLEVLELTGLGSPYVDANLSLGKVKKMIHCPDVEAIAKWTTPQIGTDVFHRHIQLMESNVALFNHAMSAGSKASMRARHLKNEHSNERAKMITEMEANKAEVISMRREKQNLEVQLQGSINELATAKSKLEALRRGLKKPNGRAPPRLLELKLKNSRAVTLNL